MLDNGGDRHGLSLGLRGSQRADHGGGARELAKDGMQIHEGAPLNEGRCRVVPGSCDAAFSLPAGINIFCKGYPCGGNYCSLGAG
ncbi:hypothetical protein GCM10009108_03200 [Castellaniella ginsengisoli]|uniref:Uncharacterized protein n=1 Tax=Castellaniella ginsengisoli TaxID=546114 RepID=A0ABN1KQF9_9BURK